MTRLGFLFSLSIAGVALSNAAFAQSVPATETRPPSFASSSGKGIIGGALLGAESVMLVEAAAGTRPAWAYAVGGGIGAIGGGVGGYFAQKIGSGEGKDAAVSLYLLVGGLALVLPTTVAVLSAAEYQPVNYTEDHPPADEPVADPARSAPSSSGPQGKREAPKAPVAHEAPKARVARAAREPAIPIPPALVGLTDGELTLSVPAVEVRQMYTRTEVALYGVKQGPEVDVPVLNVVF